MTRKFCVHSCWGLIFLLVCILNQIRWIGGETMVAINRFMHYSSLVSRQQDKTKRKERDGNAVFPMLNLVGITQKLYKTKMFS